MAAKYGKKAQDKVEKAMHERKHGTLKSGSSGKKVKSRKQAIAIGLSEARREGGKVPAALFDVTRGNLAYVFELCGVHGSVDPPEEVRCDARGGEARYRVRWS